jgi:hypothetical protein
MYANRPASQVVACNLAIRKLSSICFGRNTWPFQAPTYSGTDKLGITFSIAPLNDAVDKVLTK